MKRIVICLTALLPLFAACEKGGETGPVSVKEIRLSQNTLALNIGGSETLTVEVAPADAIDTTVAWESSDTGVATVENGEVTALAAGTADIVASAGGQIDVCRVTVSAASNVAVTGITLSQTEATLGPGDMLTLTATVLPENATNRHVSWRSSNPALATVVGGEVTALANGNVTIRAITEEGDIEAVCLLTVNWLGRTWFKSDETWSVGGATWSDAVKASGCRKVEFNGGMTDHTAFYADCCSNDNYGDLFSWRAVDDYGDQLCPDDWRVPTREELVSLDTALGGDGKYAANNSILRDRYLDEWGAEYGGHIDRIESSLWKAGQGTEWRYWSQTPSGGDMALSSWGNDRNEVLAISVNSRRLGMTVRCIK
jgi:uncharacterized protein (TIGR02145 family)